MYEAFKSQTGAQDGESTDFYGSSLSREQKIGLMELALKHQEEGYHPENVFDSFYAQDLIVFGIKNQVPEAVRLGEKMLGENHDSLSFEMAKAVKEYQLNHSVSYQEASLKTGPIDTRSVYQTKTRPSHDGWTNSQLVNMDDPYWQEFYEKNYRSEDVYKKPSGMAWDYKPHGIMDEVLDFKDLQSKQAALRSML